MTPDIQQILARLGLALGAGVLIFIVPIAYRKARWAPHRISRIAYYLVSLSALIGFCFYAAYLWNQFVPREPEAPAPVAYPVDPALPANP
ncbi:MAG TPA: hypothetical protein DCM68_04005 [Verrucomicrobia bacterium]|nr:hypothetical protein [Verrucomicrobiota bacterium]